MKSLFILLFFVFTLSFTAQARNFSSTHCRAYTACVATDAWGRTFPNGGISCEVFGAAYFNYAGGATSQCNWHVQPYTSVTCQGFVKSFDYYGNVVWGWQNFHYRCPGR